MDDLVIELRVFWAVLGLFLAYLFGSLNTARIFVFLTRQKGILETGTGNAGANNVWRVYGKKYGGLVGALAGMTIMLMDTGKGVLIIYLARDIFGFSEVLALAGGIAGMTGHNWPFFRLTKLRGGKGIAILGGILLMLHPVSTAVVLMPSLGLALITRISRGMIKKQLSGLVPFVGIPVYILANLVIQKAGIEHLDLGTMSPEIVYMLFAVLPLIYFRRIDAEWLTLEKQPSRLKALWYLLIYDRATNDTPKLF